MKNGTHAMDGARKIEFSAVILAGGKSSRMGRDKSFIEIGGQTLLARQIALAREVGAGEVFISGREGVDYSALGCRVLMDRFPDAGPLAGIERALDVCTTSLVLVLGVDMPAMNVPLVRKLLASCTAVHGAIPRTKDGIEPLGAVYPKLAKSKLKLELQFGKTPGARWLAEECVAVGLARFVEMNDAELKCFVSANTPATLLDLAGESIRETMSQLAASR